MAELGKKIGTVEKEAAAITGFGTAMYTSQGDEVGIIAPSMRGLRLVWERLNSVVPLDPTKVKRVVYFNHQALTTLRPRKKRSQAKTKGE